MSKPMITEVKAVDCSVCADCAVCAGCGLTLMLGAGVAGAGTISYF